MGWRNQRWNSLRGPDAEALRAIFHDLEKFLDDPSFQSINLGEAGASPTVDVETGVVIEPPTTAVDTGTFVDLDADLAQLRADLEALDGAGVATVAALPALPDAEYPDGTVVVLEVDNRLYRSTGGAWVSMVVSAGELDGLIEAAQIAAGAIGTDQLAANAVTAAKILAAAVETDKLAAGAVTAEKIAAWEMLVGQHIQSIDYDGTDVATGDATSGFRMEAGGDAEFNGVRVRGEIEASEFRGVPTTNLLANGTFESNTNGWSADPDHAGSTIARVTTQAHSGSASLQVGHPSSVGGAITEIDITPGMLLHVSAWVKKQSLHSAPNMWRNDVNLSVVIYAGGTPIYVPGGRTFQMLSTNWQYIEYYVPIPSALTTATKARISIASYAPSGSALFVDDVVVGQAPLMEIPHVVTSEDDSHLRSLVLPDTVGFAGPHSSYPYGMVAREAGEGRPMLDVRGPSLGPTYASLRLGLDHGGGTMLTGLADEVYLGTLQNRIFPTPYLRVSKAGNQTIANDTGTVLSFDATHGDTEGGWNGSSTYTVQISGLYLIHYALRWGAGTGNTWRQGAIRVDGTEPIGIDRRVVLGGQTWYQQATVIRYLAAGQTVRVEVRHASGSNILLEGAGQTQLLMMRVGDV